MENNRKVVWSEGMLLVPQHFQQWGQYYDSLLDERIRQLTSFGWGAAGLDLDHDGIANGRFTLLGFRGVMPDGLVIRIPDEDPAPQTRLFGDVFRTSMEQLDVHLGVPVERSDAMNCRLEKEPASRAVRYQAEYIHRIDETTGDNSREVLVARKDLRILFSGEETEDMVTLKIGELMRTSSGAVGLRETYIPPCVSISASNYLMRLLRGLIELLSAKAGTFENPQRGVLEVIGMDLGKLSFVQALYSNLPVLVHINHVEKVHPEVLYLALARLAGQLMVVANPAEPMDVPLYQHDNLGHTFGELDRQIRRVIERMTPTQYVQIPLEGSGDNVWVGRVPESRLFGSSQFFLVAAGELSEDQIRSLVPQYVKVGSPAKLKEIVAAAMPGVRLYHTPRPPATLPVKIGHQYFRLDDRSAFWEEIKKSQVVALHVPDSLQALRIQLLASKE